MSKSSQYISFEKFHGTGNDFIVINGKSEPDFIPSAQIVSRLCDRHFGIGADGLIIIHPSDEFSFRMQYFNSDGLEGTMCGNGGRVAAAYAVHRGMVNPESVISFLASDGVHHAFVSLNEDLEMIIELEMKDVLYPASPITGTSFIDTGSPHLVIFTEDADRINVFETGSQYRNAPELQPGGANINFVSLRGNGIYVRTYERGVENETLSCGTGVTASAIVRALQNQLTGFQEINVETRGGKLHVSFEILKDKITAVKLKGPATRVFSGIIYLDAEFI